jgi:hypothetical protein
MLHSDEKKSNDWDYILKDFLVDEGSILGQGAYGTVVKA